MKTGIAVVFLTIMTACPAMSQQTPVYDDHSKINVNGRSDARNLLQGEFCGVYCTRLFITEAGCLQVRQNLDIKRKTGVLCV